MAKTSTMTGSQKKTQRELLSLQRESTGESVKAQKRQRHFTREGSRELEKISKGKGLPESKYKHMSLQDLIKDFTRAGKGAEKIFADTKEQAVSEFNQYTRPQVAGQFAGGSAGSSAMNQALSAAQGNLQRGLASDFAGIQANLAGNLLGQRENQRQSQYEMQQRSDLSNLESRLRASGGMIGQQISPSFQGGFNSPYQQKSGQASATSNIFGGLAQGGGTALAAWQLGKLVAAPVTGGASLAIP